MNVETFPKSNLICIVLRRNCSFTSHFHLHHLCRYSKIQLGVGGWGGAEKILNLPNTVALSLLHQLRNTGGQWKTDKERQKMPYPQWQWGQLAIQPYWELSLHVSGGWGEPLCMAGGAGTHRHFFPSVSTPDSLFHTSAFPRTFTATAMHSSVARSPQGKERPSVKESLAISQS